MAYLHHKVRADTLIGLQDYAGLLHSLKTGLLRGDCIRSGLHKLYFVIPGRAGCACIRFASGFICSRNGSAGNDGVRAVGYVADKGGGGSKLRIRASAKAHRQKHRNNDSPEHLRLSLILNYIGRHEIKPFETSYGPGPDNARQAEAYRSLFSAVWTRNKKPRLR